MTIEQAIKDIKDNVQPFAGGISIEMAIKALEEIEEYRVKEFQCHLAQQEGIYIGYAKAIDECIKIIEETVWRDTDMLVESIRELKGVRNE